MKKMTMTEQWPIISYVTKKFGIKWTAYVDDIGASAWAAPEHGSICVAIMDRSRSHLMSMLFHEICHCIAFRTGKYIGYHDLKTKNCTRAQVLVYKRTALSAELYVDSMARKLLRKTFPSEVYLRSYTTKESRDWLKLYVKLSTDDIEYKGAANA